MRKAIGFGLMFALVLAATSADAQDLSKLAGTYKLVSGEKGDGQIAKDRLDGIVRIMQDTMTLFDKDNNEVYVMRYSVDKAQEPARITMTVSKATRPDAVGSKAHGLIKAQGNLLTIIYDYKGGDYPSDFHPKGATQHLFVMERTSEK